MRLFVGDDWAEDHHDIEVMDQAGKVLAKKRLPEGVAGMAQLHELIGRFVPEHADEAEVVIGIETDRGPWVAALIAAGYVVFPVNPLQASRYRERHGVSGAKSDPLTELTAAVDQVSGRAGVLVASVAGHEHRRRWTAGSVPACGAAARVAGVDRGCVRAVPAGRCGWDDGRPGGSVSAGAGGVRARGRDAAVVCV